MLDEKAGMPSVENGRIDANLVTGRGNIWKLLQTRA